MIRIENLSKSYGAAQVLRDVTLDLYRRAAMIAEERGMILADTKFEFGIVEDGGRTSSLVLADEVLTPDSSRFWSLDAWAPGKHQVNFDKQFVRDWLLSPESGWLRASDTTPPPLPSAVVERTRERYLEAFRRLTGREPLL